VTFCYRAEYSLSISAPETGNAQQCYSFTSPKSFSYCYKLFASPTEDASCEMLVDDVICNTCSPSTYNGTDCVTFDCTNTPLEFESTFCDYSITELQISSTLLYDFLPCSIGCSPCGVDRVVTE
jgi:hypothetical protein